MDPLVAHSLDTGLVTMSEVCRVAQIDETLMVRALMNKGSLSVVSAQMALNYCTKRYRERRQELVATPTYTCHHGVRKGDRRGSLNIPAAFRRRVCTETYRVIEATDAYGNPVLIISGAHNPDPELNLKGSPSRAEMPAPEVP